MGAFSIHKTNPRLTGNIKVVVDSNSKMFIESINSSEYLSRSSFKGFEFNENLDYGTNIRNFCSQLTNLDAIYDIYDETLLDINESLGNQYHQLYQYGCYSEESQLVNENLRFFAPLHVQPNEKTPDLFVILRVPATEANILDFDNPLSTWINQGEVVHVQDLAKIKTAIFEQLQDSNIDMQFNIGVGSNGLNLRTGLWNRTEDVSVDELLHNETTITEFENWITNAFKRNNLIYSNIVNLEFAFTDDTADNRFTRYVGVYVNRNDVTFDQLREFEQSGALRLIETATSIDKFQNDMQPETYHQIDFSRWANGFGLKKSAIFEFNLVLRPQLGESLVIKLGSTVEHTIYFNKTVIGATLEDTKKNIINNINTGYQGNSSTIKASIVDGWIRLESNSALASFEQLQVVIPSSFIVRKPLFTLQQYENTFIAGNDQTISLNEWINPAKYPVIMYIDANGIEQLGTIQRVYKYKGDYLYKLDKAIDKSVEPDHIWFVQIKTTQPILASLTEHHYLDFDQLSSDYTDILDFDINKYKDTMLSQLWDPSVVGDVLQWSTKLTLAEVTEEELKAYKTEVQTMLLKYFDTIDLNRNYLFKNLDLLTSESTTTSNEYLRLNEESNEILSRKNRLYQFINKWAYKAGTDVYGNPYRLNISLPFRYDNFSPAMDINDRDIRYHTHSWFILGEGQPPYFEVNESNANKLLSYTKFPVEKSQLLDTNTDAYLNLAYQTEQNLHTGWSDIFYDKNQDACYTFFRGVLYRLESNKLDGYRFAIIMKSSDAVLNDVFELNYFQNDTFKTLTLVIDFYIPDPVLTSLERGKSQYWLDRSLLYFSNEIYTTSSSAIDFGTDQISLRLYDTSAPKTYLGQNVGTNWWYESNIGRILQVSRGNSALFNTSFRDILTIGGDFEINYTSSDNINSPWFGMIIKFEEIVEITKDHFWCKRIIIDSNLTIDPDGVDDQDIADNVVQEIKTYNVWNEFESNPKVFYQNNTVYISRAIAYENCIYDKIVSASANNARYKEISLSNISNFLLNNAISVNSEQSWLRTNPLKADRIHALISKWSNNGVLDKLHNPYMFPMNRWSGKYYPLTKTIFSSVDVDSWSNVFPSGIMNVSNYRLNSSRNVHDSAYRVASYAEFIPTIDTENFYTYLNAVTGKNASFKELPWMVYPKEHRNFCSLVFNSQETVTITTEAADSTIDLVELLRKTIVSWLQLDITKMSNEQKVDFIKLYYDVDLATVDNFDIEYLIVRNFVETSFLQIYRIDDIRTNLDQIVQFNIEKSSIQLLVLPQDATTLTIQFIR